MQQFGEKIKIEGKNLPRPTNLLICSQYFSRLPSLLTMSFYLPNLRKAFLKHSFWSRMIISVFKNSAHESKHFFSSAFYFSLFAIIIICKNTEILFYFFLVIKTENIFIFTFRVTMKLFENTVMVFI